MDKGLALGTFGGLQMSACKRDTGTAACCASCGKALPIVNGELQPWRASNGEFFCNEFCADDADERRFQRHGKANRTAPDSVALHPAR